MQVVVIGAGHNGLVASTLLARAGLSVQVVERAPEVGGLAAGGTFGEGHAHFGVMPDTAHLAPQVVSALDLQRHGLQWTPAPALHGVDSHGRWFTPADSRGWADWSAQVERYRELVNSVLGRPAPPVWGDGWMLPIARSALDLRRLGQADMMSLLRLAPTCADDALAECFEDPAPRAVLAGRGLLGTWMGPRSPTGTAMLYLDHLTAGEEVVGGGPALVRACQAAANAAGVQFLTDTEVHQIRVDGTRAVGVSCANGREIDADRVLATCDPRTALLDLVRPQALPVRVENQAREHRVRGIVAVVHLALDTPLRSASGPVTLLHTAAHPDEVERAFDAAKQRRLPTDPPVLLRCHPEAGTATAWVHGVPHDLDEGWTDAARERVLQGVLRAVERVAPGFRDTVRDHEVLSPVDLAARYGLAGGHLWHGELALDQLASLRPGLDLSRHATPIEGLYLGSGGTHPGGGLTGRPGMMAASAVLEGLR